MKPELDFATLCIHAGYDQNEHLRSRRVPLYQSAAFTYDSADHASELFSLEREGYIYMRLGNPTVDVAEKRVAALEGGLAAVGFASGMAATTGLLLNMLRSGDEVLSSNALYGGTVGLLRDTLPALGIQNRTFDPLDAKSLEAALTPKSRVVIVENLANPSLSVPDHDAIAEVCKRHRLPLVVDNTIATPYLSRPIAHGADFVLHSCTKYMEGHGAIIGGMVVDAGTFTWDERYPAFHEAAPSGKSFVEAFGKLAFLTRLRGKVLMNTGGCMAPFHAFLLVHGLESLHVRMARHCENALALAQALRAHPKVAWVRYPGLEDHPSHANARRYLQNGFGGMLGFGLKGGYEACKRFVEKVKVLTHTTNIGDAKTLVIHPASTTHRNLTVQERQAAGISDDFLRVSVGLESIDDLLADIEQAMD